MLGIIHCGLVTSFWNLNQLLRISQGSSWLTHSKVQNLSHESPYLLWLWLPLALSALASLLFREHSKNWIPQHLCTFCSLFLMLPWLVPQSFPSGKFSSAHILCYQAPSIPLYQRMLSLSTHYAIHRLYSSWPLPPLQMHLHFSLFIPYSTPTPTKVGLGFVHCVFQWTKPE